MPQVIQNPELLLGAVCVSGVLLDALSAGHSCGNSQTSLFPPPYTSYLEVALAAIPEAPVSLHMNYALIISQP